MEHLTNLHRHGVFLRREALRLGVDESDLYAAVRKGRLARARHGAYVRAAVWREADEVERHRLRAHAVGLSHQAPFSISHISGALLHGIRAWNVDLRTVHVSRPTETGGGNHNEVRYHQRDVSDHVLIDGTPVAPAAVCALESACLVGVEEGVVILDSAYHLGLCTPTEVRAAYLERLNWPGTARLRVTLPLAQQGAQSVGESRLRVLFWSLGIPKPVLQFPVEFAGRVVAYTDFAWPELGVIGEFDGRVKYELHLREGERPSDVVVREKRREDQIRELTGWKVLRFTWGDLSSPGLVRDRWQSAVRRAG